MHRIYAMPFAVVYQAYINKLERKGHTKAELDKAIEWLTGFDAATLAGHLEAKTNFRDFYAAANIHPNATLIKGVICGVRIENIEDPLMQQIRYLDKLVDEIGMGRPMEKVLRAG